VWHINIQLHSTPFLPFANLTTPLWSVQFRGATDKRHSPLKKTVSRAICCGNLERAAQSDAQSVYTMCRRISSMLFVSRSSKVVHLALSRRACNICQIINSYGIAFCVVQILWHAADVVSALA
jgi:hypothetical protein